MLKEKMLAAIGRHEQSCLAADARQFKRFLVRQRIGGLRG
jgi:hypothetical protein